MVALAAACALIVPPAAFVERSYSNGAFRWMQPVITGASNLLPFALFDVAIVALVIGAFVGAFRALRRPRELALPFLGTLLVMSAGLTLWFFAVWGFNIRRLPLRETVAFDSTLVTRPNLVALAERAVAEMNRLAPTLPATWPSTREMERALAPAFAKAEAAIGAPWRSVPARSKASVLSPFLGAVGLNGTAIPFFGEALLNPGLLAFEQPYVIAHEWVHVAGRRSESEAAFVGWLACMYGPEWAQYSAWMRLYRYAWADVPRDEQRTVHAKLDSTTRLHFAQSFARSARDHLPAASAVQRAANTAIGRAIRVEKSASDYGLVVQLVLGVQLADVAALRAPPTPGPSADSLAHRER